MTDEYVVDAWGKTISSTGTTANANIFKGEFLAYRQDPNAGPGESTIATHNRIYEADTGKWKSDDPVESDPNSSRYVKNNPVNYVDPSGLDGFGHHFFAQEVIREFYTQLSEGAIKLAYGYYSGATDPSHRGITINGIKHSDYNKLVQKEFEEFLRSRKPGAAKVTQQELREFIDSLLPDSDVAAPNSRLERIRSYNKGISLQRARKSGKPIDFRKHFKNISNKTLSRRGRTFLRTERFWELKGGRPKARNFAGLPEGLFRRLTGIVTAGTIAIIEGGVAYGYETVYLEGLGEKAKHNIEAMFIYNSFRIAREEGHFGDVANTPFPSDAQLLEGVELDLAFKGSFNKTLDREAAGDITTYREYPGLIAHLVPVQNGAGVEFRLRLEQVIPPEQAGNEPPFVRTIVDPFKPFSGLGKSYPIFEGVRASTWP